MVGVSSDAAQTWQHHQQVDTVTHSKDHALDEREFELLYEGAQKLDGYRALEAQFIVLAAGRLGMRGGEITHFLSDWVNWREKMIEVPAHQPCDKGKDGGRGGHCEQLLKQTVRVNDDVDREDVEDHWWRPKTQAAVRGIPFGQCPRFEIVLERFLDEFDRFERSFTAIGRRVDRAAEHAEELDPDEVFPHALRATAATHLAGKGLDANALCSMFGWTSLSTARVYLARSDSNTKRAVRSIHSQ